MEQVILFLQLLDMLKMKVILVRERKGWEKLTTGDYVYLRVLKKTELGMF